MPDSLLNNIKTLLCAIEDCRDRKQTLPSLILLYTGIDILASLERSPKEDNAAAFKRWSKQYLLSNQTLRCSAGDLWRARCGILHAFAPLPPPSRKRKALPIRYAWGKGTLDILQEGRPIERMNTLSIHVDDLIDAFKRGIAVFLSDLSDDPKRKEQAVTKANTWFAKVEI